MKEALNQFSFSSIEFYTPTFDSESDAGSDSQNPTHQNLHSGPDSELHTEL